MTTIDVNDFSQEKQCTFEGERYSVRDNGAVIRHPPESKRTRSIDNQWTFGKENSSNPYLYISSVRVHRIVATAFHGEPPDPRYVVDHIDTNCRNNRPENLRWLTRLENALKNPATRKKVEFLCGSIEAFLKNPSMLNELQGYPNFKWMRTVTPDEAQNCLTRMSVWANLENKPAKSSRSINSRNCLNERVYRPLQTWEVGLPTRDLATGMALTPWCAQYLWNAPSYFPCCPKQFGSDPIDDYFQNLKCGAVLNYSDHDELSPKHTIVESLILKQKSSILVLSEREDGRWAVVGIALHEKSRHFIHYFLGSHPSKDEADKAFREKNEITDFPTEAWNVMQSHDNGYEELRIEARSKKTA